MNVMIDLIMQRLDPYETMYGFMSDRGTYDEIFILCQLHEKHLTAYKPRWVNSAYV